jgi:hypothetical protein
MLALALALVAAGGGELRRLRSEGHGAVPDRGRGA